MTAPFPEAAGVNPGSESGEAHRRVAIGVLALQGAFAEHAAALARLGADVREVRLPEEFEGLDGIVLPGGESTAMALIGERWGVFPRLKRWVSEGRPVWGTCAGLILLSDSALLTKRGGQSLVGGLNVDVCRNYFGSQMSSFEVPLDTSLLGPKTTDKKAGTPSNSGPYPAVFIRAPAVLEVGAGVDVLCRVRARPCDKAVTVAKAQLKTLEESAGDKEDDAAVAKRRRLEAFFVQSASSARDGTGAVAEAPEVIVAVRKGNIVGTAFHPELTNDSRWHDYFVRLVREAVIAGGDGEILAAAAAGAPEVAADAASVVAA